MDWRDLSPDKHGEVSVFNSEGLPYRGLEKMTVENARHFVKEGLAIILNPMQVQILLEKDQIRSYVMERDRHICHYCGRAANTMDHKTPKALGGLDIPENCVAACHGCNGLKQDMPYDLFVARYPRELLLKLWDAVDAFTTHDIKVKVKGSKIWIGRI